MFKLTVITALPQDPVIQKPEHIRFFPVTHIFLPVLIPHIQTNTPAEYLFFPERNLFDLLLFLQTCIKYLSGSHTMAYHIHHDQVIIVFSQTAPKSGRLTAASRKENLFPLFQKRSDLPIDITCIALHIFGGHHPVHIRRIIGHDMNHPPFFIPDSAGNISSFRQNLIRQHTEHTAGRTPGSYFITACCRVALIRQCHSRRLIADGAGIHTTAAADTFFIVYDRTQEALIIISL